MLDALFSRAGRAQGQSSFRKRRPDPVRETGLKTGVASVKGWVVEEIAGLIVKISRKRFNLNEGRGGNEYARS